MSSSISIRCGFRVLLAALLAFVANNSLLFAQDSGQALRVWVGYRTLRNSAHLNDEAKAEADRLEKLAIEERAAKQYSAALKHLYQGIALMRGQKWTAERSMPP